jgi:uncharacterized protein
MIFVDTGAWYASEVEDDVNHPASRRFLAQVATGKHGVPVTTDYVLDEAMTLLRSRRGLATAGAFIEKIRSSKGLRTVWIDEALFTKATELFLNSEGRTWSFTDCTSFVLMKQLSITESFAFDSHFKEAGFVAWP